MTFTESDLIKCRKHSKMALAQLYNVLWLVVKNRTILFTNQMQNSNHWWLCYMRFLALGADYVYYPLLWLAFALTLFVVLRKSTEKRSQSHFISALNGLSMSLVLESCDWLGICANNHYAHWPYLCNICFQRLIVFDCCLYHVFTEYILIKLFTIYH